METPCCIPSEGHHHGGWKATETSVIEICYWNEKLLLLEVWYIESDTSSSAKTAQLAKT